jgi:hypothetical protein
MAHTKQGSRL